jgi:hypothetical protein
MYACMVASSVISRQSSSSSIMAIITTSLVTAVDPTQHHMHWFQSASIQSQSIAGHPGVVSSLGLFFIGG